MSRAPPTDPSDVPSADEITATVGPDQAVVFDGDGHLTTLPARWWAIYDRRGDPAEEIVRVMLEKIERDRSG